MKLFSLGAIVMRKATKIIVVLTIISVISAIATHTPTVKSQGSAPLLGVIKYTDKDTVEVGGNITVFIEIRNYGNETAYNITLKEEYPEWGFEVLEHGGTNWDKLDPNETVITYFKLRIKNYVTGFYSLGETKVTYYDSKGRKYTAYSKEVWIRVIYYGANPVDIKGIWRNTGIWVGLLLLSMIAPLIFLEYSFYRSYRREMEEKEKKKRK